MLLSRVAGSWGTWAMTNVAEPTLQAQELAGGKDVCLQRAETKEKAQAVQYQSVPWQQNGVHSSSLAVSALYPGAHFLRFVRLSCSSGSWDGDEVPIPSCSSAAAWCCAARHSLSPQSWQPSHSLKGELSAHTLAKSKSPCCQEPAF